MREQPGPARIGNEESAMGRKKNFSRESVLEKALPVFWEQGYAATSLQDLERATGVNRSGLYGEFADKDALYVASLGLYLSKRREAGLLTAAPPGWGNVERFLREGYSGVVGQKGCFSVSAMRELAVLPDAARVMMQAGEAQLKAHIAANIRAAAPLADADALADVLLVFFFGVCMDQQMNASEADTARKIDAFLHMAKAWAGRVQ